MREKNIEKYLIKLVQENGGICKKWVSPGWNGAPDRIVMFPYVGVFFVETKAPNGRLRPSQIQAHRLLEKMDQKVSVLYTKEQVQFFVFSKVRMVKWYRHEI